jgi:hypothetical protein
VSCALLNKKRLCSISSMNAHFNGMVESKLSA